MLYRNRLTWTHTCKGRMVLLVVILYDFCCFKMFIVASFRCREGVVQVFVLANILINVFPKYDTVYNCYLITTFSEKNEHKINFF